MQNTPGKLNILFVTPSYIYPCIGGDRIKPFKVLEHLAKTHNVTLVSTGTEDSISDERINAIKALGADVYYYRADYVGSAIKSLLRTTFAGPLESEYFNSQGFSDFIKRIIKEKNIDFIFNFFERTTEAVKRIDLPKLLMADDSRALYQERTFKTSTSFLQKAKRIWEFNKLKKYEKELYGYFDNTTFVSDVDLEYSKSLNNEASFSILSNGVDIEKFKATTDFSLRKDAYFIGKLDVWVNLLMIERLLKYIYPGIKKAVPETKLYLVGFNPPKSLFKNLPKGVEIVDSPESVIPFYEKARLFIHPQFEGSGIQNKVLEALSMGAPVVSTPIGTQGINIINGKSGIVADNIAELIAGSIKVLTDDEYAKSLSISARNLIENNYTWKHVGLQVDSAVEKVIMNYIIKKNI